MIPTATIASERPSGDAPTLVAVRGVSKTYRSGLFRPRRREILREVSLGVLGGEAIAILGPNGSGKTTLLKMIAGLVAPDRGTIQVGAAPVPSVEARRAIGFATGDDRGYFLNLTGRENLRLFGGILGMTRDALPAALARLADELDLASFIDEKVAQMSSGMKARLGLARALLGRPRVLLLDEPTKSLDKDGAARVHRVIRASRDEGNAVLFATHSEHEVSAVGAASVRIVDGSVRWERGRGTDNGPGAVP